MIFRSRTSKKEPDCRHCKPASNRTGIAASIQTKLTIGQPNDRYEQEAGHVINNTSVNNRLDQRSNPNSIQAKTINQTSAPLIQRHAFVGNQLVDPQDATLDNNMKSYAADNQLRDYIDMHEFQAHASAATDHIGNLFTGPEPGLWVRFPEQGLNILGEDHTRVTLKDITPAVGTTNFIGERFASEDLSETPELQSVYEENTQSEYEQMGISQEFDKSRFAGEPLLIKTGYVLSHGMQFLEPQGMMHLAADGYFGKPFQRYLILAWAWSKDNLRKLRESPDTANAVSAELQILASVHEALASDMDPFIDSLVPGDPLEFTLGRVAYAYMIPVIRQFSEAFTLAIVRMVADDANSGLNAGNRNYLRNNVAPPIIREHALSAVRNEKIRQIVVRAAANNVRYAGYGFNHAQYLANENRLPANSQLIYLEQEAIPKFRMRQAWMERQLVKQLQPNNP